MTALGPKVLTSGVTATWIRLDRGRNEDRMPTCRIEAPTCRANRMRIWPLIVS